jgi:RNA polymerase sigma factor (sigma-70 family)
MAGVRASVRGHLAHRGDAAVGDGRPEARGAEQGRGKGCDGGGPEAKREAKRVHGRQHTPSRSGIFGRAGCLLKNRPPGSGKRGGWPLLGGMGTSTWPPNAPPFRDLVRAYERLIQRTARRWGVRPAEVEDCAQEVLVRFYRAIVGGRLDASRPAGIGGWLKKTTRSVARDFRARRKPQSEVLATNDALDRVVGTDNPEGRMAEAMDVHDVVDRCLDKMPWKQREIFILVDLEDTPMGEVLEDLGIESGTAYSRLAAARATFAREWEAMQKGGTLAASLALLTVAEVIAAEHTLPDVPPGFTDGVLRRLGEELGQDFLGPAGGSAGAGLGAKLGAAAAAAKAGGVTLTVWQIGLGVLLAGLAGAGLMAALRPAGGAPRLPVTVVVHDEPGPPAPSLASAPSSPGATIVPAPSPPGAPAGAKSSAPPASETETTLVESARALLGNHQPSKALALLARVTAPDLAEERDELRRRALGQLQDAGQP